MPPCSLQPVQTARRDDRALDRLCVCVRVLRNAESRRGICFALWQTRRHRDPRHFIRRDRGSCEFDFVREEEGFHDFFFESLQITYDEKVLLYFGSIKDVFD